ncbi:guanine deaminase [Chelatococcus sp. SYSU_G07232]|uniref:Guanine deaminase n=1 Tax=Chelatococcus albus TaxID=3047466 RepID=A0ABT7ACG8_9HYPH|nr:guanine deaminase [Chelatococcus sp. SYSU_G07232]MDJ1157064.1 guanine deaminase [Chelatococcus sp. SYSU_G07232]
MTQPSTPSAIRGRLLIFLAPPAGAGDSASYRYIADGLVTIRDGRIAAVGEARDLLGALPADTRVDHHPDGLIVPGFIDPHIHFPQTQVIASYGAQLLEWLQKYTFVEEQRFADPHHAAEQARFFFDELLRNGTTTATAFCSVHPASVDAFFAESERRGMAMIAGKVMMDRNAPPALTDTAETGYEDTKALLAKWHRRGRQRYAITPRFAITSTEAQLEATAALAREFPDNHIQTHLSENLAEIETVRSLFPSARGYLDVYDRYGLLGPRTLLGHSIHLTDGERRRMAETGSVAVFCPTSNLFLGSGLFNLDGLIRQTPAGRIALATDVGGGTSFSMLRTAGEAYKVLQLNGRSFSALEAFHQMTAGNAAALGLADEVGTLAPGRYADLVVLDARATPAMANRMQRIDGDLEEELFLLMTLGDDRAVRATYVQGRLAHARDGVAGAA